MDPNLVAVVPATEDDREFFILPAWQNIGIGWFLLRRVLAQADRIGAATRVAFLEGNRVEPLYQRFGFRLTAQRDNYCFVEREPQHSR